MKRLICLLLICAVLVSANPVPSTVKKTAHFAQKVHHTLHVAGEIALSTAILLAWVYAHGQGR